MLTTRYVHGILQCHVRWPENTLYNHKPRRGVSRGQESHLTPQTVQCLNHPMFWSWNVVVPSFRLPCVKNPTDMAGEHDAKLGYAYKWGATSKGTILVCRGDTFMHKLQLPVQDTINVPLYPEDMTRIHLEFEVPLLSSPLSTTTYGRFALCWFNMLMDKHHI